MFGIFNGKGGGGLPHSKLLKHYLGELVLTKRASKVLKVWTDKKCFKSKKKNIWVGGWDIIQNKAKAISAKLLE